MSRNRSYYIECDGDDCTAGYEGGADVIDMCETRQEAERQARLAGWLVGRRERVAYDHVVLKDLCPECRP